MSKGPEATPCRHAQDCVSRHEYEHLRRFRDAVVGWREYDWPEGFDRCTAELIVDNAKRVSS